MYYNKLPLIFLFLIAIGIPLIIILLRRSIKRTGNYFSKFLVNQTMIFKDWIRKVTRNLLIAFANKIIKRYEKTNLTTFNSDKISFEDLAPSDSADESGTYSSALNWALQNPNIKNLALTGPFGSGKSSVLKTFKKNNPQYEFLSISLASFTGAKASEQDDEIEKSILNQIFYYVKPKAIPESRYRRINILSNSQLLAKSVGLIIFLFAFTALVKKEWIKPLVAGTFLTSQMDWLKWGALIVVALGSIVICYLCLRMFNHASLKKLSLTSGEIELGRKESSILNGHIDEILYFFEVSKYNVVFIEDLDRFADPIEIFTKLREINGLINNANQVKRNVVFIYAVMDELMGENRTKFFDFILPVIPVINTSNSKEKLIDKLTKSGVIKDISSSFISYISIYIDDMRVLTNIINEFLIYKNRLSSKFDLNPENLLGMIIYKNIMSEDFSKLHNNQGIVYEFFSNKKKLVDQLTINMVERSNQLMLEIESADKLAINTSKQLKAAYLLEIYKELLEATNDTIHTPTGRVQIGQEFYSLTELADDDLLFDELSSLNRLVYEYRYSVNLSTKDKPFSFLGISKAIDPNLTYQDLKNVILLKENNDVEKLKSELENITLQLREVNSFNFKTLLEKHVASDLDNLDNKEQLIGYLIRNGYLDEHYHLYISNFYGNSISAEDKEFLLTISYQKRKPFDFKLIKIPETIEELSDHDFDSPSVLNYSLIDYMLLHAAKYRARLQLLMFQLSNESESSLEFIDSYRNYGSQIPAFMLNLAGIFEELWAYVDLRSNYSDDVKKRYLKLLINYVDTDIVVKLDKDKLLSLYISNQPDFLIYLKKENIELQGMELLQKLDVKFKKLTYAKEIEVLLSRVLKQDLYQLNEEMISFWLTANIKDKISVNQKLRSSHYTTIRNSNQQSLNKYIDKNLKQYVVEVLLGIPSNVHESESTLMELLVSPKIPLSICEQLIDSQEVRIKDLNSVGSDLWEHLIKKSKVVPNWPNLVKFIDEFGVNEKLIVFLNTEVNYKKLSSFSIKPTGIDAKSIKLAYGAIIKDGGLSELALEAILQKSPGQFEELDITDIPNNNLDLILDKNVLSLSQLNYGNLKKSKAGKNIILIEQNKNLFLRNRDFYELDNNDRELIFNSKSFTREEKVEMILQMDIELLVAPSMLALRICKVLAGQYVEISYDLLYAMMKYALLVEPKIALLNLHIFELDKTEIDACIKQLKAPYFKIADLGTSTTLAGTADNISFAENLNSNNLKNGRYVSSITHLKDGKVRINAKRKR